MKAVMKKTQLKLCTSPRDPHPNYFREWLYWLYYMDGECGWTTDAL